MIYHNGEFYRDEDFKISPLNDAFMCGYGVYETLRTYKGELFCLEAHIERLFYSADRIQLEIRWPKQDIVGYVNQIKAREEIKDVRLKIIVTEDDIIIWARPLVAHPDKWYRNGISVLTYGIERFMPGIKTLNCLASLIAKKYAEKMGVYEVLLVDKDGVVREGSKSNVFWIKNQKVYTTKTNILKGITRKKVFKITKVIEKDCKLNDILNSDEVFITNTTSSILPVTKIDDTVIGDGRVGGQTISLMSKFKYSI